MNIGKELSKIAKVLVSKDRNEDISWDVASRIVNRRMSPKDAFVDIGYGSLWDMTRQHRLPYGWESFPVEKIADAILKELNKIRKAAQALKFKIVYKDSSGKWHNDIFATEQQLKDAAKKMGMVYRGVETSQYVRPELRGKPKFDKLIGPMWDGNIIRYEDQETYDMLSK